MNGSSDRPALIITGIGWVGLVLFLFWQEFFAEHPPATSMVEVRSLIHQDMLIEIEVDAIQRVSD